MWDKLKELAQKYAIRPSDARIGAVGAEPIRDLHKSGNKELADQLTDDYYRANMMGINFASGAVFSPLVSAGIGVGTTLAEAPLNGGKTLAQDLALNLAGEGLGWMVGKTAPKVIDYVKDQRIINKAFKSGQLKFGEPTTFIAYHQSDSPITKFTFPFKRWDVEVHGADPNAAFFTVGNPADAGFLSKRPYTSQFTVTSKRPLIQTGEIKGSTKNNMRNAIVKRARSGDADAVIFNGIADNQLTDQNILMAFDKADIKHNKFINPQQ